MKEFLQGTRIDWILSPISNVHSRQCPSSFSGNVLTRLFLLQVYWTVQMLQANCLKRYLQLSAFFDKIALWEEREHLENMKETLSLHQVQLFSGVCPSFIWALFTEAEKADLSLFFNSLFMNWYNQTRMYTAWEVVNNPFALLWQFIKLQNFLGDLHYCSVQSIFPLIKKQIHFQRFSKRIL